MKYPPLVFRTSATTGEYFIEIGLIVIYKGISGWMHLSELSSALSSSWNNILPSPSIHRGFIATIHVLRPAGFPTIELAIVIINIVVFCVAESCRGWRLAVHFMCTHCSPSMFTLPGEKWCGWYAPEGRRLCQNPSWPWSWIPKGVPRAQPTLYVRPLRTSDYIL